MISDEKGPSQFKPDEGKSGGGFLSNILSLHILCFCQILNSTVTQGVPQPPPGMLCNPQSHVPLSAWPLHCCCLLTFPPPFKLISGTAFHQGMFYNLQGRICFHIPQLISLITFFTTRTAECFHSSFSNTTLISQLTFSYTQISLTTKLQDRGESTDVDRERTEQAFPYVNLHHRRNCSLHLPYKLSETPLSCSKTTAFFATLTWDMRMKSWGFFRIRGTCKGQFSFLLQASASLTRIRLFMCRYMKAS